MDSNQPSPEGVDHLALPLVPEVEAPSAYLTTHSLSRNKNRNTMKGISKLSSILKRNTSDHLGNFRNLQDEIKAGNLDRECVPPQYSALPLNVSLDCTDTILMREEGICNLGRIL